MSETLAGTNEQLAAKAFSQQSAIFDAMCSQNTLIEYKRGRVRSHVQKYLRSHSSILEINCGTGEDAIWFARQGHRVHATDFSPGMLEVLTEKVLKSGVHRSIRSEQRSFTDLANLQDKGPYDMIFSNFAGLNCTAHLEKVLRSFEGLIKQGGMVTLVILPSFCLWESLLVFKGKFRTAFRRIFAGKKGVNSKVEGHFFTTWYYPPSFVQRALGDEYEMVDLEGLCTIVPPSYIEHFDERHPVLSRFLKKNEERLKNKWPWKYIGDYYVITLKKK
jgi:ubiquinone/menaquinone biosynthesis C-methylase UbiE